MEARKNEGKEEKGSSNELRKTNASTKLNPWICKDKGSFLQLIDKISSRSTTDETASRTNIKQKKKVL